MRALFDVHQRDSLGGHSSHRVGEVVDRSTSFYLLEALVAGVLLFETDRIFMNR